MSSKKCGACGSPKTSILGKDGRVGKTCGSEDCPMHLTVIDWPTKPPAPRKEAREWIVREVLGCPGHFVLLDDDGRECDDVEGRVREVGASAPAWQACPTHGQTPNAWGCPECVRELRSQVQALEAEVKRWKWLAETTAETLKASQGADKALAKLRALEGAAPGAVDVLAYLRTYETICCEKDKPGVAKTIQALEASRPTSQADQGMREAVDAAREYHAVIDRLHHGRMPDEVRKAHDKLREALATLSRPKGGGWDSRPLHLTGKAVGRMRHAVETWDEFQRREDVRPGSSWAQSCLEIAEEQYRILVAEAEGEPTSPGGGADA
ncbi:MAG TPA: hypothetical protein VK465_07070 [Fibrobacteria bacterium]|nr:hypothetical protein [Fibrobacteria bacterium]